MHLFTSESFSGELNENCNEGVLKWVEKEKVYDLNLWEGDRIFLDLLLKDEPYFLLKLMYHNDELLEAVLNGKKVL
jgi:8-oxo-dGTP diphosphatase